MRVQGSFSRVYEGLLGGSWLVIGGVISPLMWLISIVTLLITLLITAHEPPSMKPPSTVIRLPETTTVNKPHAPLNPKAINPNPG